MGPGLTKVGFNCTTNHILRILIYIIRVRVACNPLSDGLRRPPSNAQQRCELHGPRAAPARLVTAENVTGVATLRTQGELRITGHLGRI